MSAPKGPVPLGSAHVGDLATWRGVNGHRYQGVVRRTWPDGSAASPSLLDSWHCETCGCHTEPWEYEPEGLW